MVGEWSANGRRIVGGGWKKANELRRSRVRRLLPGTGSSLTRIKAARSPLITEHHGPERGSKCLARSTTGSPGTKLCNRARLEKEKTTGGASVRGPRREDVTRSSKPLPPGPLARNLPEEGARRSTRVRRVDGPARSSFADQRSEEGSPEEETPRRGSSPSFRETEKFSVAATR